MNEPQIRGRMSRIIGKFGGNHMAVLLQEYTTEVVAANGTTYVVLSYGEERADGTWTGWLEFEPDDATLPTLVTGQETSQPNHAALEYWASGLEPTYFEGAFERARESSGA